MICYLNHLACLSPFIESSKLYKQKYFGRILGKFIICAKIKDKSAFYVGLIYTYQEA